MNSRTPHDITRLLSAWRQGDSEALSELVPLTYGKLKEIAGNLLRNERRASLQTTALVHEAYLRLADLEQIQWRDRVHYFAMSARIMRRVLVDEARRRSSSKRSGEAVKISIDELHEGPEISTPDILGLEQALKDLHKVDPERARIVEMRYFGGLRHEDIAEVMGVSVNTVARRWRSARAWLLRYLHATNEESDA